MTDTTDLLDYLAGKGIYPNRAAGQEVTAHCWWCPDGDPKGKGRLYLNTESWLYDCKRCGEQGNRRTLLQHFGDEDDLRHVEGNDPMLRRRILGEAADLAHEMLLANPDKLDYLTGRGISAELIVERKLGYVPKNVGLSEMLPIRPSLRNFNDLVAAGVVTANGREFFNDCITIPYFSHGTVVQIRAKFIDGKYLTTAGDHVRLYNADALHGADRVLITEGELDCLAVESQLQHAGSERTLADLRVTGLPGAGSWPEGLEDMLGAASKVFLGLDPDDTGQKFQAKLAEAIGQRARNITLPSPPKTDWTDWFQPMSTKNPHGGHTWRDLRDLLVEADLAGKQMFSIQDIAMKWNRRQIEAPGLQLGWQSIDAVMRPGLKPGQVFVPLATTGTGKTVWLSNLAHNLARKNCLYVSLEMTAPEVYEHMRRIHRFFDEGSTREVMNFDYARLRVTERNRIGRGDLGDLIHEYQDDVGASPDLVIVDYLQYYARGFAGGSMYDRVSDAIMEVKAVAKEEETSIVIPSQVNRGAERGKPLLIDDARDAGTIEETSDFVMSLFRPDQVQDREGNQQPVSGQFVGQFLKSRHGGVGKTAQMKISNLSLAIVDSVFDRKNALRVEQENQLYRQGLHYEDYLAQLNKMRAKTPGVGHEELAL